MTVDPADSRIGGQRYTHNGREWVKYLLCWNCDLHRQHLCTDGVFGRPIWKPGKAKDCPACKAKRLPRSVKKGNES